MNDNRLSETIEDHALERVPDDQRQGWLALTWSTAGVVVSLVQLFFGALVTFVAGFQVAVIAGLIVAVICWPLSWASSHVAYRTGLSSTVMSRYFGFGKKGSVISSIIYSFMIIGFLALENVLLYRGFLFYFELHDTLTNKILIYGLMTTLWIVLTSYGFKLIARTSSITLILSSLVLVYITYLVVSNGDRSVASLVTFGPQFPHDALKAMGADSPAGRFIFAVNVLIGSAGGMAMFGADIGRYARRSRDVGISTLIGLLSLDVGMLWLGGIIMYAGGPALVDFYTQTAGMSHEAAQRASLESPDSIVAAFVVLGGAMGAWLLVLAQGKTQVLNNYAASLSLSNLFDALNLRMSRLTFVILANVLGLLMLYGSILELINSWVTILGVLVTAFAGIIVADYYIVKTLLRKEPKTIPAEAENMNWAGGVTLLVSAFAAHYVLARVMPIEAITTLIISITLYPLLRTTVLKPTGSGIGRIPEAIDDPVIAMAGVPAVSPNRVS